MSRLPRQLAGSALRRALGFLPTSRHDRALRHLLPHCSEETRFRFGLPTLPGLLRHLRRNGFQPSTVVDVGACVGEWSRAAAAVFPGSDYVLIEANPENGAALERTCLKSVGRFRYVMALLGSKDGEAVDFYQSGTGSSVLPELTRFSVGPPVRLPMTSLDTLVAPAPAQPVLLKLDVQGYELEVLRGGPRTLSGTEVVVLEASLLPYNAGAPLFAEVVAFMECAGFVVFDFCGQLRRQSDHALFQTDVVFVRTNSPLRAARKFWLDEP